MNNQGFTFFELMVVMALLLAAGSFCAFADIANWRGFAFGVDRQTVLAALRRTRALALGNVCAQSDCAAAKSHGVHFDPVKDGFIVFHAAAFGDADPENEEIKFEDTATKLFATTSVDVIFMPIAGNAPPTEIILKDDFGKIVKILINSAGGIDWQ